MIFNHVLRQSSNGKAGVDVSDYLIQTNTIKKKQKKKRTPKRLQKQKSQILELFPEISSNTQEIDSRKELIISTELLHSILEALDLYPGIHFIFSLIF